MYHKHRVHINDLAVEILCEILSYNLPCILDGNHSFPRVCKLWRRVYYELFSNIRLYHSRVMMFSDIQEMGFEKQAEILKQCLESAVCLQSYAGTNRSCDIVFLTSHAYEMCRNISRHQSSSLIVQELRAYGITLYRNAMGKSLATLGFTLEQGNSMTEQHCRQVFQIYRQYMQIIVFAFSYMDQYFSRYNDLNSMKHKALEVFVQECLLCDEHSTLTIEDAKAFDREYSTVSSTNPNQKILFVADGNEIVEIDSSSAICATSSTIRTLLGFCSSPDRSSIVFKLPADKWLVEQTIAFSAHYIIDPLAEFQSPLPFKQLSEMVQPWYSSFIDDFRPHYLASVVSVAMMLDLTALSHLACAAYSVMIRNSTGMMRPPSRFNGFEDDDEADHDHGHNALIDDDEEDVDNDDINVDHFDDFVISDENE